MTVVFASPYPLNYLVASWGQCYELLPGGIVSAMLEKIGLDHCLEENLVDSLNRFQTQIKTEVQRQANALLPCPPSEAMTREQVCD